MKRLLPVLIISLLCLASVMAAFDNTDVWLNDYNNEYQLFYMNASDNYTTTTYSFGENHIAHGLIMDSTGSLLTVLDLNPTGKLLRWDATNGYALSKYAFSPRPRLLFIDKNDNVWVTTVSSNIIMMLNASDNYSITNHTFWTDSSDEAKGGVVDNDNMLYISPYNNATILQVDLDNNFTVTEIANASYKDSISYAIDLAGNLVIIYYDSNMMCMYDKANSWAETCYATDNQPYALCIDKLNDVIVGTNGAHSINMYNYSDNYAKKTKTSIHFNDIRSCGIDANNDLFIANNLATDLFFVHPNWVKLNANLTVLQYDNIAGTSARFNGIAINPTFDFYTLPLPLLNTAPSVAIVTPANETVTNNNSLPISFMVTDVESSTANCLLYVDSILNASNASVSNDTLTDFAVDWTDGSHTFYVTCTDGGNLSDTTGTYSLLIDTLPPMIESSSPSLFNTTTFTNYTMQITGNTSNTNIINLTRIIYYPNMSVFNYLTTNPSASNYSWDDSYNTTSSDNGIWSMYVYSEDSAHNTKERDISFTVGNCVPNYQCGDYLACNASDLAACNETLDLNNCSYPSPPAPSTFSNQACNYCSADVTTVSTGACDSVTDTQWVFEQDNNWAVCCNVTQIVADCPTGLNTSTTNTTQSCSIFDYTADDISSATISGIGKFIIVFAGFAGVIALILIGGWVRGKIKK